MTPPRDDRFLVSEVYTTVQGESSLVGLPTVFVRLYSCNLRCVWCDSMHAVEGGDYREMSVDDLVRSVSSLAGPSDGARGMKNVCWTGGEPLLQWRQVAHAIERLPADFVHSIETDGEVLLAPMCERLPEKHEAGLLRYIMDVKCPGSGMEAKLAFENLPRLRSTDEVKFVIADRADYEYARALLTDRDIPAGTILFSPVTPAHKVASGLEPATLAAWILEDRLRVRLQLQVHKVIWPGVDRGI